MLLFSWKKIYDETNGVPSEIIKVIRMLTYKDIPKNKRDQIYKYADKDFSGVCFLVHPEVLLYNAYKHSSRDLAIYLSLASLRSLPGYLAHSVVTLPLLHSPVDPREYLQDTSLLYIKDDLIHFLYEEESHQTKH